MFWIKMGSMQIVFLFDLNACSDFHLKTKEELNKKLLSMRLACVRLLTEFSSKTFTFKWGFKFFDSSGSITQIMHKSAFSDVSLEAFETLENEICVRYERHLALMQALETSQKKASSSSNISREERVNSCPVKILQFALTQILCEFQWESIDMWSPSTRKFKDKSLFVGKKNFVFLFSDFQDNDKVLFNYFGLNILPSKQKFINTFLPHDLRESLLQKADIQLVILNTCQHQIFMSTSSGILPLLSESLHSIQGSMIPLSLLSQPMYNMQFLNSSKNTHQSEIPAVSELYSSFHNSLMPFSSVFQQSLHHLFYSKENSIANKCCMNVANEDVVIPLQVVNIQNKENSLNGDLGKNVSSSKKTIWSKFIIHSTVSKDIHYPTYEIVLCLPDDSQTEVEIDLIRLNKNLCLKGVNLLLDCITDCGIKMPGLFMPISNEAAIIYVLHPPVNLLLNSGYKTSNSNSFALGNIQSENLSWKIADFKTSPKKEENAEQVEYSSQKPFQMECMEAWFKPTSVPSLESYIQSRLPKKTSMIKSFYKMLQLSVQNSKKLSSRLPKENFTTGHLDNSQESQSIEESLSDISYEELLPTVKNIYDSGLEQSGSVFSSSKKIVNMVMNYYKKKNISCPEDDFQNLLKNNLIMTARGISEKYEKLDSTEDTKKKIKECQIQVLLILEIENCKMCPDKSNCVSTVSSLLRLMVFYSGITELQNFMHDVLLKNYNHHLYDVLLEIADELGISIFDDTESVNSPADTVSSELMNEDEIFSSTISSNVSEKSPSSTCSRIEKDNNGIERKLLRRRSDISDTASFRQVLLPKSSAKKRKRRAVASKSVRCSPRIASRRKEEHTRTQSEKPRTVRRNLFPGSSQSPKTNKNNQPSTPKRKKAESHISKTKYVAETPSHKQNHSALQRRKSFMDKLSDSPKVIAESPQIAKSVKDGANKELLEKLQRARQNPLKSSLSSNEVLSSQTFTQYTPESKRRLSLKLFSKLLASPTARMGIKKCTKRLFDQISPTKDGDSNNKRHKVYDECEQASYSALKLET